MKDLEDKLDIIFDKCCDDIRKVYKKQKDYIEIIHSLDGNNNEGKTLDYYKMFNQVYTLVVMNTSEEIMWRYISLSYHIIDKPYEDFDDIEDFYFYCDEHKQVDTNYYKRQHIGFKP